MNVRIVDRRVPAPRVEYAEEAELAASERSGPGRHIPKRIASSSEEPVVARSLVGAQHSTQFLRNCECHQKVMHRQEPRRLLF